MVAVELSSPASACSLRIVCLFQGAVDAVCALGLQDCLVGRSHQCTGPASVLVLPCVSSRDCSPAPDSSHHCDFRDHQNVFDRYNVNWELLEDLKPDLIFSQGQSRLDSLNPILDHQLTDSKCRIVSLQSYSVEDILQNLETIASYCGVKKEGVKFVTLFRTQWKNVKQNTPQWTDGVPNINVAFLSCVNPLVGAGYWVPEIITCAGGLSCFGKAGCPSKSLTLGDLTQINPDVIVYTSHRLHVGSLATELSWLFTNKEWKNLKAIKANRFFVIDANRFFIDSAPNIISSTELMTEILHGFGYGHEGRGFIRWQSLADSKEKHDDYLQYSKFENKLEAVDSIVNYMDEEKHEICSSASEYYNKYVTNVYEVREPPLLQEGDKVHHNIRQKPDAWYGELGVIESKKEDIFQHMLADRQRCLETKTITPDIAFQFQKVHSQNDWRHTIDYQEDWGNQITDELSPNVNLASSAPINLGSHGSFNVHAQEERNVGLGLAQTRAFNVTNHCCLPEQSALGRAASSAVYKYEKSTEVNHCDQQLLSKIWAFTESAAEIRNQSMSSTAKQKAFRKSISLPVSHGSVTGSPASNEIRLSAEMPRKTNLSSVNMSKYKPPVGSTLCKLSAKDLLLSGEKQDMKRATQSSTLRKHEEKCCSEKVSKRQFSYSVPSSPKLDVIPRISRRIRDLVLKCLVNIEYTDCLLLSGGLASSILAEAVPLVHSTGFRMAFTVLAGPAATDRASAAVAAKCKGMQHVIVGEGEKGFAVFLLAKELAFIVETLKTFDPVQVRNLVPLAAALREAKNCGFMHVVTGDGLDELLFRDHIPENGVLPEISKVLPRSTVLLGKALGIKVVQPFLNPNLIRECKALICTCGLEIGPMEHLRGILRKAFPEVSAACSKKSFNEVDSGMFYVSDYFSSAISASVIESKAKSIFRKERIHIRDAEHLVYYRAFRKAFKGKVPRGMVRWASRPCSGCGYQLSTDMNWYCLVCGLRQQSQKSLPQHYEPKQPEKAHKTEQLEKTHQEKPEGSSERQLTLNREVSGKHCIALVGAEYGAMEMSSVASVGSVKVDQSKERDRASIGHYRSSGDKAVGLNGKHLRQRQRHKHSEERGPNYWALLGAGSAGLLLLLHLSRR